MADLKITELPAAGALSGAELVELVQGGVNVQSTAQDIADLGGGGGAVSSVNTQTGAVVLDAGDIGSTPVGGVAATDVQSAIQELDSEKQATLVSGTNIKTINSTSILGSGDLAVSGGHVIEDEGTPLTQRANMNFVGAGVAVTDAGGKTVVTISGSSSSAWSDSAAGLVERSTTGGATEAENIATQAGAGTASGLDAARTPSEVGLKDMLIKLFNTAVTWVAKMTFTAAPRFNSTTASQFLTVDGSKDLASVAGAASSDLVTGSDTTKPLTSAAFKGFRDLSRTTATNSAGTITLDVDSKQEARFETTSAQSSAFTIAFSNDTNVEIFDFVVPVTGTIAITVPSSCVMATVDLRWNNSTKIVTVAGTTAQPVEFSFLKISSSRYLLRVSYAYNAS